MSLWSQLMRRNVFKVGTAYLVVAWLLIQVVSAIEEPLRLPDGFDTAIIVFLAIGFPVALVIAWAFELTPEGIKPSRAVDPEERIRDRTGRTLNYLIIGALSLVVVFLVFDSYVFDRPDSPVAAAETADETSSGAALPTEQANVIPNSIAILPFEAEADDASFAEGVYIDIFLELEKLDQLTVIGRRTMKSYENTPKLLAEIAAETNAQSVLELLVRFAGDRVRIVTELVRVDGRTEDVIWTQAYEEEYTADNLFEVQADIARNIAERLVGALSPTEEARLMEVLTENAEALAYYLRALPYIDDGTQENADNCLEPISQAVALDPRFKEAWYRKAGCHNIRSAFYPNLAEEEQQRAVAAIEQALAIDDNYADAQLFRVPALASGGNWRAVAEVYQIVLGSGVQPGGPIATQFLFPIGHLGAALEAAEREFNRDPASSGEIGTTTRMKLYEALGDVRRADQTYQLGRELYQPWPSGDFDRLVVLMGRARQGQIERRDVEQYFREILPEREFHNRLAEIFDDREAVVVYLRERIGQTLDNPFNQLDIAAHAAYVGEPELALEALENNLSFFAPGVSIVWMPLFQDVRQLPEFKRYLQETGMADVWAELGWPDLCEATGDDDFQCR